MTREEAQGWLVQLLLERVRATRYPSGTQLDLIEGAIPPAMVPDYFEVLMEKVGEDAYPSLSLLRRAQRVAALLPRNEQNEE